MEYEMKSDVNTQYSGAGTAYRRVGLSLFVMCMVAVGFQILVFTVLSSFRKNSGHDYTNLSLDDVAGHISPNLWGGCPRIPSHDGPAAGGDCPAHPAGWEKTSGFWFLMCIPIMYGGNILVRCCPICCLGARRKMALPSISQTPASLKSWS